MAKVDRSKANYELIKKTIGKKLQYSSLDTHDKQIIIKELLKTTNNFCPFTGTLSPIERSWTIEHFYPQCRFKEKQLDWINLFHCIGDANLSEIQYRQEWDPPSVYSPEEVDYVQVLICDMYSFQIKPIDSNDQKAINTIARYNLNSIGKKQSREYWFRNKDKYLNEYHPFYEYFQTKNPNITKTTQL